MRRFPRLTAVITAGATGLVAAFAVLAAAPGATAAGATASTKARSATTTTRVIYQGPIDGATTIAPRKMADFVAAAPFLTVLSQAIDRAGLRGELNKAGPFTLFAPDDEAWSRLTKKQLDGLFADKKRLRAVLLHHVVAGRVDALAIIMQKPVLTGLDGKAVRIVKKEGVPGVRIDGARLIGSNMVATNGLVHIVDTVIGVGTPPVVSTTTVAGGPTTLPASRPSTTTSAAPAGK